MNPCAGRCHAIRELPLNGLYGFSFREGGKEWRTDGTGTTPGRAGGHTARLKAAWPKHLRQVVASTQACPGVALAFG